MVISKENEIVPKKDKNPFILLKSKNNSNFVIRIDNIEWIDDTVNGDTRLCTKSNDKYYLVESAKEIYERLKKYYNNDER